MFDRFDAATTAKILAAHAAFIVAEARKFCHSTAGTLRAHDCPNDFTQPVHVVTDDSVWLVEVTAPLPVVVEGALVFHAPDFEDEHLLGGSPASEVLRADGRLYVVYDLGVDVEGDILHATYVDACFETQDAGHLTEEQHAIIYDTYEHATVAFPIKTLN